MPPDQHPARSAIRTALGRLVTEGLETYWIAEVGKDLLALEIVQSRVPSDIDHTDEDAEDRAAAAALVEVLTEAVKRVGTRKYRRLLRYVLPLYEEYVGKTIKERRTAAGQDYKDGKKPIKPGTIRTHHEPKALDVLAKVLVKMEAEHRGEVTPSTDADESQ